MGVRQEQICREYTGPGEKRFLKRSLARLSRRRCKRWVENDPTCQSADRWTESIRRQFKGYSA